MATTPPRQQSPPSIHLQRMALQLYPTSLPRSKPLPTLQNHWKQPYIHLNDYLTPSSNQQTREEPLFSGQPHNTFKKPTDNFTTPTTTAKSNTTLKVLWTPPQTPSSPNPLLHQRHHPFPQHHLSNTHPTTTQHHPCHNWRHIPLHQHPKQRRNWGSNPSTFHTSTPHTTTTLTMFHKPTQLHPQAKLLPLQ